MITGPPLLPNQFAVVMADGATGHVVNINGKVSLSEKEEIYTVFDNLETAKAYVVSKQTEYQDIEFVIYNSSYEPVEYIEAIKYKR